MDNLQWFKFSPSHWFMGRIQRCSEQAQARFIRLVCVYWQKECVLSIEDAKIELGNEYQSVLDFKIIEEVEGFVKIKFLDQQFEECLELGNKRSKAAKARWSKAKAMQLHTGEMQVYADKNRLDEIREDKTREDIETETSSGVKLIKWIEDNCSNVQKMSEPLTVDEAERLTKDYNHHFLMELLSEMHNYKRLNRNVSANLTFRKWANKDNRYNDWKANKELQKTMPK